MGEALADLGRVFGVSTNPMQRLLASAGASLASLPDTMAWAFLPHGQLVVTGGTPDLVHDPRFGRAWARGADTFFAQAMVTHIERAAILTSRGNEGSIELGLEGRRAASTRPGVSVVRSGRRAWEYDRELLAELGVTESVLEPLDGWLAGLQTNEAHAIEASLLGSGLGSFALHHHVDLDRALGLAAALGVETKVVTALERLPMADNVTTRLAFDEYLPSDEVGLLVPTSESFFVRGLVRELLGAAVAPRLLERVFGAAPGPLRGLRLKLRPAEPIEVGVGFAVAGSPER